MARSQNSVRLNGKGTLHYAASFERTYSGTPIHARPVRYRVTAYGDAEARDKAERFAATETQISAAQDGDRALRWRLIQLNPLRARDPLP